MTQRSRTLGLRLQSVLRISSICAGLLLLPAPQSLAQSPSAMKKLTASEAAAIQQHLDPRLLPPGAGEPEFQPDQAVTLSGPSSLKLMPVRYQSLRTAPDAPPHFQCGLFLIADNQPTRFLPTFGAGWTAPESCDGLNAIGPVVIGPSQTPEPTASTPTSPSHTVPAPLAPPPYPAIVLIYQAFTPAESFPEPILLTWDDQAGTYRPDAAQSRWLAKQKDGRTIPGARRLLATTIH